MIRIIKTTLFVVICFTYIHKVLGMQNNILDPYNSKSAQNSHARAIPKREIELGRAPALNDIKKRLNAPETHGRKRHGSAASNQYLKIRHGPAVVSAYMDDCQQNRGTQQVIAQMERDKAAGVFPAQSYLLRYRNEA